MVMSIRRVKKLVGYDVDVAQAIGNALGVKVELRATNPANRIPLLTSKKSRPDCRQLHHHR
ncbi:hypothetical protein OS31_26280 [Dickeya oryzae]